jgi:hypothetical protein
MTKTKILLILGMAAVLAGSAVGGCGSDKKKGNDSGDGDTGDGDTGDGDKGDGDKGDGDKGDGDTGDGDTGDGDTGDGDTGDGDTNTKDCFQGTPVKMEDFLNACSPASNAEKVPVIPLDTTPTEYPDPNDIPALN